MAPRSWWILRALQSLGDDVGGTLATITTSLGQERGDGGQVLLYPVTDTDFETPSSRARSPEVSVRSGAMKHFIVHHQNGSRTWLWLFSIFYVIFLQEMVTLW